MSGIVTRRTYAEIRSKKMAGNRQQKIQYLKDYYLLTAVGVILLIAVAVSLIWHVARPRTENLLYAAVIDESLDEKKLAQVTADMSNLLGADGKRKTVQIDDLFMSKMEPWINFRFIFTVSRSMW